MFINIKAEVGKLISHLSPKTFFTLSYLYNRKRFPNFDHPKDLSEIWINHLLRGDFNKIAYLADKYAVRSFVIDKGLQNLLTPLINVYNSADDIDFDKLPDRFALKMNYLAGMNIICRDKSTLDKTKTINIIKSWFSHHQISHSEQHYNLITPKMVCEEYIDDGSGHFPTDYKFLCIKGKVACILACNGRDTGSTNYIPYSIEWVPLYHYKKGGRAETIPAPANLTEMINTAEKLAQDFDLIRVDLYSNGSRIWFGEMTLTPSGCIFHRWTNQAITELGHLYQNV